MRWIALALFTALAACGSDEVLPPPTAQVSGGMRLAWTFVDGTGAMLDCERASVEEVSLDIGRTPVVRPCSDGAATFSGLLPDRYPVVARALNRAGNPRATIMSNAVVVAGSTLAVDLSFLVDAQAGLTGDLTVRWNVDGRAARTQCPVAGAEFARVVSGPGSLESFEERVPCTEGSVTIRGLRPGTYAPQVRLELADETRLATGIGRAVRVEPDVIVETEFIDVITVTGAPTQLVALWTVNTTVAVDACDTVQGRQVTFTTVPRPGIVASSTTVPCRRGYARLVEGIGPGTIDVRLSLQYSVATVTSTFVEDVRLMRGQTSTVSYDFEAL